MFYSLIDVLKATGLNKVILGERGKLTKGSFGEREIGWRGLRREFSSANYTARQCGMRIAPTLEAEIGALIKEAGDSLRGQPIEPHGLAPTFGSGRESAPGSPAAIDQSTIAIPADFSWDHQIGTDDNCGRWFRAMGLGVAVLSALGLGWIGGWGSSQFFAPSSSDKQLASVPATSPGSNLGSKCEPPCIVGSEADRGATASIQSVVSPATPRGTAQPVSGPRNLASLGAPPAPTGQHQTKPLPRPKPAPTPDTRPTTIPGWTVREIVGASIVLEGPNGVARVARGDTVPGLGRIDSIVRWGNRWIVVTNRGLITTQ